MARLMLRCKYHETPAMQPALVHIARCADDLAGLET